MYRFGMSICLVLLAPSVSAQAPLVPDSLPGSWQVCFLLDSTVESAHSTRMTCGVMQVERSTPQAPVFMRSGDDSVKIDAVLHFDHSLRFATMLGAEPGNGPVGSGTLLLTRGEVRLYLNAARGQMVFDDGSIHAVGHRSRSGTVEGTWAPSCFQPCAERGVIVMLHVR